MKEEKLDLKKSKRVLGRIWSNALPKHEALILYGR
jgi:hypothetical protein